MRISSSARKPKRVAATASGEGAVAPPITLSDRSSTGLALLRIFVSYLWFQQLFWKLPPIFAGLYGYVVRESQHAILPGYGALLVSLHFTGHYESSAARHAASPDRQAVQDFLAREYVFQQQMLATLRDDPYYAPYTAPDIVAHNRQLVRTWDSLSLTLCFGLQPQQSLPHVPTTSGETTLTVTRAESDPTRGTVDPWPFLQEAVTLRCEGRRLSETFTDEEAMRAALAGAPWVTITMHL
jgi:hypothetical protein